MKKKRSKTSKGFTLIEVVLAVALLAIASISIGSIIISTQNNTNSTFNELEMQQQIVELQESLHNEVLATNAGVKYWKKGVGENSFTLTQYDEGNAKERIVALYFFDYVDYTLKKTYYMYNAEDKTLKRGELKEYVDRGNTIDGKVMIEVDNDIQESIKRVNWTIAAVDVNNFNFDLEHYKTSKLIKFTISVDNKKSTYPAEDIVKMRNNITINSNLNIEVGNQKLIRKPTLTNTNFTYDGEFHSPIEEGYNERYMIREGVTMEAAGGTYAISYILLDKENMRWADGTKEDVTLTWTIHPKIIGLNWGETTWKYDGKTHSTTCTPTNLVGSDIIEIDIQNNLVGPQKGSTKCYAKISQTYDWRNYALPTKNDATLTIE